MLVGLLNCFLAFLLGRALFGRAAGLLLAAFGAAYWAFLYFEGELQAPVLIQTLLLLLLLGMHRWSVRGSLGTAIAAGVCVGLLALVRANALLLVPAAALWMVGVGAKRGQGRRAVAHAGVFLLFGLLAISPATLRNAIVANDFVLISSNGAINLYIGNNEESDGVTPRIPELQRWTGMSGWSWFSYDRIVRGISRQEGRELSYSEASAFFVSRALDFVKQKPGDFGKLCLKRARLFWGPDEISNNKAIRFEKANSATLKWSPGFPLVLALALAGLTLFFLDRRRREVVPEGEAAGPTLVLVGLFLLLYFLSFVPFLAAARFRVPLLPLVFVFGAYGLSRLPALVSSRAWGRFAGGAAVGIAVFFLLGASRLESEVDEAWWHTDRANALVKAGQPEAALDEFHAALAANPGYIDAHVHMAQTLIGQQRYDEAVPHLVQVLMNRPYRNDLRMQLGSIFMEQGQHARAAQVFQVGVQVDPGIPEGYFELGRALTEAGQYEEGLEAFRRSLELSPDQAEAHLNAGIALSRLGRPREAIATYREALEIDPFLATAHYNLGNSLQEVGALEEAIEAFLEAIRIEPKYAEAIINLGNLNNEQGRYEEAVSWFEKAIAIDPGHRTAQFNLSGALGNLGRIDEAISVCRAHLERDPGDEAMRQRLAVLERYRTQSRRESN
jgi:tetratricopeptide (TPR) repeat protein